MRCNGTRAHGRPYSHRTSRVRHARSRRAPRRTPALRSASRSGEPHPELGGLLLGLDVDVPADLQVIGDEADRADEHVLDPDARAARRDGRGCPARATAPRSARRSGRRTTSRRSAPLRDEARRLVELALVRVAVVEDPRGEAVRREDDVRRRAAELVGEDATKPGVVVPALDDAQLARARPAPARADAGSPRSRAPSSAARGRARRSVARRRRVPAPRRRRCAESQCFIPVKTGRPSSASSAARVSSVIAFSGEPSSTPRRR